MAINKDEQNYLYGLYIHQKPIIDFLKINNIDESIINYQHVIIINWIYELYKVVQLEKFNDYNGNTYVYVSKSFVKKQLRLLNVSTNTETKLFYSLVDIGILNIVNEKDLGNKRYIGLTKEMKTLLSRYHNENVTPSIILEKHKGYWNTIITEFGKEKDFERWVLNCDCKYSEDKKEMGIDELKRYFKNFLFKCKTNKYLSQ